MITFSGWGFVQVTVNRRISRPGFRSHASFNPVQATRASTSSSVLRESPPVDEAPAVRDRDALGRSVGVVDHVGPDQRARLGSPLRSVQDMELIAPSLDRDPFDGLRQLGPMPALDVDHRLADAVVGVTQFVHPTRQWVEAVVALPRSVDQEIVAESAQVDEGQTAQESGRHGLVLQRNGLGLGAGFGRGGR